MHKTSRWNIKAYMYLNIAKTTVIRIRYLAISTGDQHSMFWKQEIMYELVTVMCNSWLKLIILFLLFYPVWLVSWNEENNNKINIYLVR